MLIFKINNIFVKPRTNDGDYLYRSLKNDLGIEPKSFLTKNFTQAHNYPKFKLFQDTLF